MEQMIDWIDKSLDNCDLISKMTLGFNPKQVIECLEQTKKQAELLVEKEKQTIMNAWNCGFIEDTIEEYDKSKAEQYYKETFKQ